VTASPAAIVRRATIMLLATTLLWGMSFPLIKTWQNAAAEEGTLDGLMASYTLLALRLLPAFVLLAVCQRHLLRSTPRERTVGRLLGVIFLAGSVLQMWGLAWTSPALSAFITSLGSAWTPLLAWVCFGIRVARWTLLGLALGVGGTLVLGMEPNAQWGLGPGEALTLLSSLLFGVQIVLLDRLGQGVRTSHLTLSFFGVAGLLSLSLALGWAVWGSGIAAWLAAVGRLLAQPKVLVTLIVLTLLPTVLSFHWMNVYQPRVPASRAALIYLLEPIFAACISIPFGLDTLSGHLILGGTLVIVGNVLAEWKLLSRQLPSH
jgi:drug/metabolite transporter (DMT)-like permease